MIWYTLWYIIPTFRKAEKKEREKKDFARQEIYYRLIATGPPLGQANELTNLSQCKYYLVSEFRPRKRCHQDPSSSSGAI